MESMQAVRIDEYAALSKQNNSEWISQFFVIAYSNSILNHIQSTYSISPNVLSKLLALGQNTTIHLPSEEPALQLSPNQSDINFELR
jgi:hypothetical protein